MEFMATPESDRFRENLRPLVDGNQERVAEAAGISRKHLSFILNGHAIPSLDVAGKLARAVGSSLPALVSEAVQPVG